MSFRYRPVPEYQRPLKVTPPRLWPKACAFCGTRQSRQPPTKTHTNVWLLTRADLSSHTHWGESKRFYAASWILTSVWALLCATGCKGCSNLAPDPTIPCQHASPFYIVLWTVVQSQKCWAETLLKLPVSQNHQVIPAWAFNGNSCTGDLISDLGRGRPCSSSERLGEFFYSVSSTSPSHSARSPKSLSWLTALKTTWNLWKQVAYTCWLPWNLDQSHNLQLKTQCHFHY